MCDRLCPRLSQVFRQNKRATDVHDILGFRVIVFPESVKTTSAAATTGEGEEITTATKGGGVATEGDEQKLVDGTRHGSNQHQPAGGKKGCSKPARAVFTVKTFPPPYRDAESRLLHDVYEVLIGLFDEVPGRFKVSLNLKFTGVATTFDREYLPSPIRLGTCALFCGDYSLICTPSLYLFFPSSRQNYVDFPKKNGYRSVHTTVLHSTGLKMEFQVRDGRNSCLYVAVGATPQSNEWQCSGCPKHGTNCHSTTRILGSGRMGLLDDPPRFTCHLLGPLHCVSYSVNIYGAVYARVSVNMARSCITDEAANLPFPHVFACPRGAMRRCARHTCTPRPREARRRTRSTKEVWRTPKRPLYSALRWLPMFCRRRTASRRRLKAGKLLLPGLPVLPNRVMLLRLPLPCPCLMRRPKRLIWTAEGD